MTEGEPGGAPRQACITYSLPQSPAQRLRHRRQLPRSLAQPEARPTGRAARPGSALGPSRPAPGPPTSGCGKRGPALRPRPRGPPIPDGGGARCLNPLGCLARARLLHGLGDTEARPPFVRGAVPNSSCQPPVSALQQVQQVPTLSEPYISNQEHGPFGLWTSPRGLLILNSCTSYSRCRRCPKSFKPGVGGDSVVKSAGCSLFHITWT